MIFLKRIYKKFKELYYSLLNPGVYFDYRGKFRDLAHVHGFLSQRGQDYYLIDRVFDHQKNLFFVEVGANHPINDNNSISLETQYGWKGISIDPIQKFEPLWKQKRSSRFINACIAEQDDFEVEFSEVVSDNWESMLSGVNIESSKKFKDKGASSIQKYKLKTQTLQTILNQNQVQKIDTLFIDTEGFEMNVLKGIQFDKVDIRCICLENDDHLPEIRKFLKDKGFVLKAHILGDDIYLKKSNL